MHDFVSLMKTTIAALGDHLLSLIGIPYSHSVLRFWNLVELAAVAGIQQSVGAVLGFCDIYTRLRHSYSAEPCMTMKQYLLGVVPVAGDMQINFFDGISGLWRKYGDIARVPNRPGRLESELLRTGRDGDIFASEVIKWPNLWRVKSNPTYSTQVSAPTNNKNYICGVDYMFLCQGPSILVTLRKFRVKKITTNLLYSKRESGKSYINMGLIASIISAVGEVPIVASDDLLRVYLAARNSTHNRCTVTTPCPEKLRTGVFWSPATPSKAGQSYARPRPSRPEVHIPKESPGDWRCLVEDPEDDLGLFVASALPELQNRDVSKRNEIGFADAD
ncbi:hypothetical protein K440DRAFT_636147 [Wilcoxina mikolae CBS 423.85]|nr:hypothetical protein K440DRAFT_636147 [Wilcoxina mikolae CBS 423.85]